MTRQRSDLLQLLLTALASLTAGYWLGIRTTPPTTSSLLPQPTTNPDPSLAVAKLRQCTLQRLRDEKPPHDDPDLVHFARSELLVAPDPALPYNLRNPDKNADNSQFGQLKAIRDIFNDVIQTPQPDKGGFFIEAGAFDGEGLSNTLWFERNWQWTGLLVETDSKVFKALVSKNRKAWLANLCLSPTTHPGKFSYYWNKNTNDSSGTGLREIAYLGEKVRSSMYCVPLFTLLLALNRTEVDLFSLDIEGAELDILLTIPFDKVTFKVFTIETFWIPGGHGTQLTKKLLNKHGYKLYGQAEADFIFVHSKYLPQDFVEIVPSE